VRRPALRELIGVERRLNAAGWYGWASVWELTGGRGYLDRESLARGAAPYRLEDVAGALFLGASESRWDPGQLKVSFRPVDGPLPSPQAPLSDADALSYAAYTVGTDWQDAVARAPADHPYLLLVTGTVTIGVQDR